MLCAFRRYWTCWIDEAIKLTTCPKYARLRVSREPKVSNNTLKEQRTDWPTIIEIFPWRVSLTPFCWRIHISMFIAFNDLIMVQSSRRAFSFLYHCIKYSGYHEVVTSWDMLNQFLRKDMQKLFIAHGTHQELLIKAERDVRDTRRCAMWTAVVAIRDKEPLQRIKGGSATIVQMLWKNFDMQKYNHDRHL